MDINIEFEITPIDELTDALIDCVNEYYFKDLKEDFRDPKIETDIDDYLNDFKENLYCVTEFPYVDKVYRDSYYNYYSSKHYSYQRDCIRVSIFNSEITPEHFTNFKFHSELQSKYLGFFIIRPTTNSIIGRSLINKNAFNKPNFNICECKIESLVYGVKLETSGFPHSSQDGETIKCAETTIWAIMDYFSNKYIEYKQILPTSIRKALERFSYQRQLPSNGLTMDQISFALKEFGFGTRIYSRDAYPNSLLNIIDYYIESGIPVLTGLESGDLGHVIIVAGKKYSSSINWNSTIKSSYKGHSREINYFDSSDIRSKYIVQDDNLKPYRTVDLSKPGFNYNDEDAKKYKIDSIVVPLYPKIYLEAVIAKELLLQIIKDRRVGYDFGDDFVLRVFLSSSRSFKNHVSKLKKIDSILQYNLISSKMPKFIWCGEIYSKSEFERNNSQATGLVILDATEANRESIDAFIFAGYPNKCISMSENNYVDLEVGFKNYYYYCNLK